jgi:hypothetical protein
MDWKAISALPDDFFIPTSKAAEALNFGDTIELLVRLEGKNVVYLEREVSDALKVFLEFSEKHSDTPTIPPKRYQVLTSLSEFIGSPEYFPKLFIKKCDLVTLRDELAAEEKTRPLSSRRERTLLKMIGALLSMKYKGSAYLKSNGNPNVSRIADDFYKQLASSDIDDNGLSDKTIRSLIPESFEAIEENKISLREGKS